MRLKNMYRFLICQIVLFGFFEASAYCSETDSLEKVLKTTSNGPARVDILNAIAKSYSNESPDNGIYFGKKALKIAKELKYFKGIGTALKNTGINYWRKADYPQALDCYMQSIHYLEKSGDTCGLAYTHNNIGLVYYALGDYELSLDYYQRSLSLHRAAGDFAGIAKSFLNIGLVFNEKKEYDSALIYQFQSLEYSEKIKDTENIANSLNYIAVTYLSIGNLKKAEDYLFRSREMYRKINSTYGVAEVGVQIASYYYEKGDCISALKYAKQSYDTSKFIGARFTEFESAKMLSTIYRKLSDFRNAYYYNTVYSSLIEEIYSKEKEEKIKDYKLRAELEIEERKEHQEEDELRLAKYRNKFLNITYLVVISFILSFAGLLGYDYKKKKQYSKELEAKNQAISEMLKELKTSYDEIKNKKSALEELNIELKEANATKDKFFSIIAHDLKGPAGSFMNISVMLNDTYDALDEEDRREIIGLLKENSIQLSDLINNLLTWSRSQSGQIKFMPEPVSLDFVIKDVVSLLEMHASEKNIRLNVDLAGDSIAMADINMLNTVLRNLVSNAIKFTPDSGEIFIDAKGGSDSINVSVRDTGVGINEESQKKLFGIDTHFTSPGTRQEKGTGLGLILCKDFVEKHSVNGQSCRLNVKSRPGQGSTFSFNIPVATV